MHVCSGGNFWFVLSDTYALLVVLQLKLASYCNFSLLGLLRSTTVSACAVPTCHASLNTTPFFFINFAAQSTLFLFSRIKETMIVLVRYWTSYRFAMFASGSVIILCAWDARCACCALFFLKHVPVRYWTSYRFAMFASGSVIIPCAWDACCACRALFS